VSGLALNVDVENIGSATYTENGGLNRDLNLTSTPTRYSYSYTIDAAGTLLPTIKSKGASDFPAIQLADYQLEKVSGQTDDTVPSEYVSTDSAYLGDGSVKGVQYFTTENSCSVTSNVVTGCGNGAAIEAELHVDQVNAVTPSGFSDADTTTGWTSMGAVTWESQDTVVSVGSYAISATATDGTQGFYKDIATDFSLGSGRHYMVQFDARHTGTGGDWDCRLSPDTALSETVGWAQTSSDTTFVTYTRHFYYDANYRYFGCREASGTNDGGVYFDNFSVTQVIDGYLAEEARTNKILQSRQFDTTWADGGTPDHTQNAAGIDGSAVAWTLTYNDAGATESVIQSIAVPDDSNTHTISVYIDKDADETRFPSLYANLSGGVAVTQACHLNTSTGAFAEQAGASSGTCAVVNAGAWWRLWITIPNDGSGNTSLQTRLIPAASTVIGTASVAATGSAVFDQVDVNLNASFPTSPIFTTTAEATRNADALSYPADGNISDTAGSVVATFNSAAVGNGISKSILRGDGNGYPLTLRNTTDVFRATDGTTANFHDVAPTVNTTHIGGATWGGTGVLLLMDGTVDAGGASAFDGDMDLGATLGVGFQAGGSLQLNGTVRDLYIYQADIGQTRMEAATTP
jgi:hypothetical protein